MVEDIKEFDKLVREKKISDVDEMLEESKKRLAKARKTPVSEYIEL